MRKGRKGINPGKVTMASFGTGSASHLAGELFKMMAGINLVHVPYRGGAPMVTDLIAGQVQVGFDVMVTSLPHVRTGALRALGVAGSNVSNETFTLFGLDQHNPPIPCNKNGKCAIGSYFCESIICDNAALRHCVTATGVTDRLTTMDPFRGPWQRLFGHQQWRRSHEPAACIPHKLDSWSVDLRRRRVAGRTSCDPVYRVKVGGLLLTKKRGRFEVLGLWPF